MIAKIDFNRIYYYFLLLSAFALPLSRAMASIFVVASILFLFLSGNYKKIPLLLKHSKLALAVVLLIIYKFLSLLWSYKIGEPFPSSKTLYIEWIAIFAIALLIKKEQIFSIISAFIAGMFISEIISYSMFFHLINIKSASANDPTPFMINISYSLFLAFTSIILLNRILSTSYPLKKKLLYGIFFITVTGNLFISNGRTGQLAFIMAILATFIIHYKFKLKTLIMASIFTILIIFIAYNLGGNNFKYRVQQAKSDIEAMQKGNFASSWGLRAAMYVVAYDAFKKEPILGAGIANYHQAPKKALEGNSHGFRKSVVSFISQNHLHSQYLHEIVSGGIVALILLLYIFYEIFRLNIGNKELKELSILFGIIYLVAFIPEPLLIKQFPSTLFILFMGLFLAASKEVEYVKNN
jgi:O-antigen ligase